MTEQEATSRFYTPEEVAEQLGHIAPLTIRRLVAQGAIPAHRGARSKVLMDAVDIAALKDHLRFTPDREEQDPDEEDVFRTTSRSKARAAS